mgnify:FL=1
MSASTSKMGADKANELLSGLVKVLMGKVDKTTNLKISSVNKKFDENSELIDQVLKNQLKNLLSALEAEGNK